MRGDSGRTRFHTAKLGHFKIALSLPNGCYSETSDPIFSSFCFKEVQRFFSK
jgi:hypothetical protein